MPDNEPVNDQAADLGKLMAEAVKSRAEPEPDPGQGRAEEARELPTDQEPAGEAEGGDEIDSGEAAGEGSGEDGGVQSGSRAEARIRELTTKLKEEQKRAKELADLGDWLLTPEGQEYARLRRGEPQGRGARGDPDYSQMTEAEIVAAITQQAVSKTGRMLDSELRMRDAIASLQGKYKDFDAARDGPAVRRVFASGVVATPDAAYFAAFPDRVQERAAHVKRANISKRTTPAGNARAPEPSKPDEEAKKRYEELVNKSRSGDRSAVGELIRLTLTDSVRSRRG